jgi:hypothetical protein
MHSLFSIEWVHRMVTTGLYGKETDGADPGYPDAPFDPVKLATARRSLVDGHREFLHPSGRAQSLPTNRADTNIKPKAIKLARNAATGSLARKLDIMSESGQILT